MPQAPRGLDCRLRAPPGDGLPAAVQEAVQAHFHGEPETVPPPKRRWYGVGKRQLAPDIHIRGHGCRTAGLSGSPLKTEQ